MILAVYLIFNLSKKSNDQLKAENEYIIPVLEVHKGGRVNYSNDALRNIFDVPPGKEIDLEILSKKTNAPQKFFEIFTKPGSYQFEINDLPTEITSVETNDGMYVSFHNKTSKTEILSKGIESSYENFENKTSKELSELAKFSYSLKNIHESEELFSRIQHKLEDFLPVEIFGFILLDDQTKTLEAKKPFKGIPDPIVEVIKTKVTPQSKAEKILLSNDILITQNAMDDQIWEDLGLNHFAQAASIRDAILIPLSPANEVMGYVLAANHLDGSESYSQDEIHSLIIVANQAAPIIENFYLLLQAKNRTHRAEALRRISSLVSSTATFEEILSFSVKELAYLLQADSGAVYLIDQENKKLQLHQNSIFGNSELIQEFNEIPVINVEFTETVTSTKKPLLLGKFDELIQTPLFYDQLLNRLTLQSAIIFPIILRDESIGELFFGNRSVSFFDQNDVNIIASVSTMIANFIETEKLSVKALEAYQQKVEQEKLVHELQRINEFNQKLISLNPDEIFKSFLLESIKILSDVNAGWLGIVDEDSQNLTLKFTEGFSDSIKEIRFDNHQIFMKIPDDKEIFVKNDLEFPDFYEITEQQASVYLASTNFRIPIACLIAPIKLSEKSIGVLVLEKYENDSQFSDEDESIIQSLAQQVRMAISNVDLLKKSDLQTNRLKVLTDLSKTISSTLDWNVLKESLLTNLQQLVEYDTATLWVKEGKQLRIAATNGFTDNENREGIIALIEDSKLFLEMFETKKPILISTPAENIQNSNFEQDSVSWLGMPLISHSDVIGVIALEKKEVGFFTEELVQLVESFTSQAAIALTNADLYQKSKIKVETLDGKSRKLDWLNRYSSEVNKTLDIEKISLLAINHLTELIQCDQVTIFFLSGKNDEIDLFQINSREFSKQSISIFNVPLFQQLIQSQGTYFISNLADESGIDHLKKNFSSRETQSILLVPLLHQNYVYGWIGIESKEIRKFFHEEVELALAIANQTSLAIRNASLYSETKSLNENLEKRVAERSKDILIENRNTEMLLRIATELAGSLDVDQILDRILLIFNDALEVSGSLIYILEGKKVIQINREVTSDSIDLKNPQINELLQQVMTNKKTDYRPNLPMGIAKTTYHSWLITPLIFGEMVLGVFIIFDQKSDNFSSRDIELSQAVAGQISLAINNAEIFNLLRDQSEYLGSMLRDQEIETSRSKAILEAVADGVLVTGVGSEIILINPSARKILGVEENWKTLTLEKLKDKLGEKIKNWFSAIEDLASDNKKLQFGSGYAEKVELADNHFISVHLSPVVWNKEMLGTVSIFRDISVEVQIDQLKSDFISNISHELRTPLTSIKGYVEILLMEASGKINNQQQSFLTTIKSNTNKLTKMVDEILDVNKIGSSNFNLEIKPIHVVEIIQKVISDKQTFLDEKHKIVSFHISENGEIPMLTLDPLRFEQIINNLLNNAIEYSFDNAKIFVNITSDDKKLNIEIKDEGIGIPLEEQPFVFDRFFRGKNAIEMNTAGAGLGLSIAKTLVEAQGGTISLSSSGEQGDGVAVVMSFPKFFDEGTE